MRYTQIFRHARSSFTLLALAAALTACGGGGYGGGGGGGGGGVTCGGAYGNACPLPTITLTAPAEPVSGTVTLSATASAASTYGVKVTKVDFLIDGTVVGTATTSPYSVMWDSTTVPKGSHMLTAKVTDSVGGTATTPVIMITTTGTAVAAVAMRAAQIFPAPMSHASGMADLTVKLDTGATRGTVRLAGLSAIAVTINEGFAGATGPTLIRLTPSADNASEWAVPANALLTAEQLTALSQGGLYLIAASAANPRGEIRGQIALDNIAVSFSRMAPASDARGVNPAATGLIATTVDRSAHTLTIHVNSVGVEDADRAEVGGSGHKLAALTKDSVDMGHWSAELVRVSADDIRAFEAGRWYATVATPVDADGALRGEISGPGN